MSFQRRLCDLSLLKRPRRKHRLLSSLGAIADVQDDPHFIEKFRSAARKERYERSIGEFLPKRREKRVCSSVRSEETEEREAPWIGLGHDLKPYVPKHRKSVLSMVLESRLKRNKSGMPLDSATRRLPHIHTKSLVVDSHNMSAVEFALELSGKLAARQSPKPVDIIPVQEPKRRKKQYISVQRSVQRSVRRDDEAPLLRGWEVEADPWN